MTSGTAQCPVCTKDDHITIHGPLKLCPHCRIAFHSHFFPAEYNDNYFLDEYQGQYGVTYIDDFPNIYALSKKRLDKILHFISRDRSLSTISFLDAGAAAGFFLKCVLDHGIGHVTGVEISSFACRYAEDHFGIPMIQGNFRDIPLGDRYDVITAWYFIEHCDDPISIIRKIFGSLQDHGIFAFSVPSIFGPMFRFNRDEWITTHPPDHRIDVTPGSIRRILERCGFRIIAMVPGGIHPERVVPHYSLFFRPFSALYDIFSRLTCFSDTIEVYAVKRRGKF